MKRIKRCFAVILAAMLFTVMLAGCTEDQISLVSEAADIILEDDDTSAETETQADETAEEAGTPDAAGTEESGEISDETAAETETEAGTASEEETAVEETGVMLDPDGTYDSKEEVALYIYEYGGLPSNYITKKEAENLGWSGGSLEDYAEGKCIGGSHFGNYEGVLPDGSYTECDIDTLGKSSRGAKRIVFSDDGYIYYTEDHYETFELLYTPDGPAEETVIYGE